MNVYHIRAIWNAEGIYNKDVRMTDSFLVQADNNTEARMNLKQYLRAEYPTCEIKVYSAESTLLDGVTIAHYVVRI